MDNRIPTMIALGLIKVHVNGSSVDMVMGITTEFTKYRRYRRDLDGEGPPSLWARVSTGVFFNRHPTMYQPDPMVCSCEKEDCDDTRYHRIVVCGE